jgi:chromosome segregation ATPase
VDKDAGGEMKKITSLRDQAELSQQQINIILGQRNMLEADLTELNNAISNIETRLPTLEKEKKLAATARNFKEAARLAKEVKAMQADEQSKAAKRDQIKDELEGVTKEVDAKTAERNQKKAKLEQAERQVELDQLETVKADFLQVWREELVLEYPK